MGSHRLALVIVGIATVAAAGTGSYLATRHNASDIAAPAVAAAPAPATAIDLPTSQPLTSPPKPSQPKPAAVKPAPIPAATRAQSSANAESAVPAPKHADEAPLPADEPPAVAPVQPPPPEDTVAASEPKPLEPVRAPEPARPSFEEVVISQDAVIGLQTEGLISSDRARLEDRVEARVSRDVRVGGVVAIPAGTRAHGNVVLVERGGKVRDRARLGIRFHTLELADGTRLPISTETIFRYGEAPGNGTAARIGGGAVAGAILGAIVGGGKGAAIGAATGAGAGTATVVAGDRNAAVFPPGADVTARILSPITVSVERP